MQFPPTLSLLLVLSLVSFAQSAPTSTSKANSSSTETAKTAANKDVVAESPRPRIVVSSLQTSAIEGFETYDPALKTLIEAALNLASKKLAYQFGSSNPKAGGMDCSGTIYHLLREHGKLKDVPRQSDHIGEWSMNRSVFYRTESVHHLDDSALSALRPGDLLFWSGTYDPSQTRKTPITHVMLYLGKHKTTQKPLMFGASEGRSYQGKAHYGVSVFDFTVPKKASKSSFYGYAPLPGHERAKASPLAARNISR